MCLILLAIQSHPIYKLILAANRDEYYKRKTQAADWWEEQPYLLAGKDLQAGGTWLGLTKTGKIAAITNYRSKEKEKKDALSRGLLVTDFLTSTISPEGFFQTLNRSAEQYNGFNLFYGDIDNIYYFSNRQPPGARSAGYLPPGIHGVSNALLDTPWPKIKRGKEKLQGLIANPGALAPGEIFSLLADKEVPPDDQLPDTGYGMVLERILGPLFIDTLGYGTRSSTIILVDYHNRVTFIERNHVPSGEKHFQFTVPVRK